MASDSETKDDKAAAGDAPDAPDAPDASPKPASEPPAAVTAAADEPAPKPATDEAKTEAAKPAKPAGPPPKAAAPPPADAAPLKPAEIAGIVAVLAIIAVGLYFLLRSPAAPDAKGGKPSAPPEPQDKAFVVGKTVDVELTLLPDDKKNVACASTKEVGGKHCEFEAQDKPWSRPGADDTKLLKPYATTGQLRLLASGLWNDEAFVKSLPTTRFRAKCKYTLEGKLGAPDIRWNPSGPWRPQRAEWWVGSLSACKVL